MSPQVIVYKSIRDSPLLKNIIPGGAVLDLQESPNTGRVTAGLYRNTGEAEAFDVEYPINEFKYVLGGELRVSQEGVVKSGFAGDLVFIPAGAKITIYPTKFEALFVSERSIEHTGSKL